MSQTPPNTPTNNELDDIDKAAVKTAEYLYGVETDKPVPPELMQAISTLRQLINEEFVHKNKSVSSQFIYDIINPTLSALIDSKVIEATAGGREVWVAHNKGTTLENDVENMSFFNSEREARRAYGNRQIYTRAQLKAKSSK